jgi:aerobic-type carbon monoxide dehydrogenase small subunit (CoxS/CutS family)
MRQILQQKTEEQFTLRPMPITLTVNGQNRTLDIDPDTPLLWAIRETLGLTGTKFGCGIAQCGACTGACQRQGRAVVHHAGVVG